MLKSKAILYLIISSLLLWLSYSLSNSFNPSLEGQAHKFESILNDKEEEIKSGLEKLESAYKEADISQLNSYGLESENSGLSYFIFKSGDLVYWTEDYSKISQDQLFSNEKIIKSSNGWHRKIKLEKTDTSYIGLILIQRSYPFENQYLRNYFHKDFNEDFFKHLSTESGDIAIKDTDNETLFYVSTEGNSPSVYLIVSSILLLFISIYLFLFKLIAQLSKKKSVQLLIGLLAALSLRVLLFFNLPPSLASLKLFKSNWFAINELIPSLGDFLFHILLVFFLLYQIRRYLNLKKNKLLSGLLLAFTFVSSIISIQLIEWSISSSTINYDLSNFYELNYLSFIGFLSFTLIICCCIVLIELSLKLLNNSFPKGIDNKLIGSFILLFILGIIIIPDSKLVYSWIIIPLLLINFQLKKAQKQNIFIVILLLLFSSSVIAYWMNSESERRDSLLQKTIVQKLAEERDPVAEYLFNQVQLKLVEDSSFLEKMPNYWQNKEQLDAYLREIYFNSYWDKYQIALSVCSNTDSLQFGTNKNSTSCRNYFQNRIRLEGDMVSSNNLFQLSNLAGRIDYIGEIELKQDSSSYYLYVELSSIYLNENEGYPELLIDENSKSESIDLSHFSYAVYDNNELVYNNGDFNYSTKLKVSELVSTTFYQYQTANFQHLAYQKDNSTTILLSKASSNSFDFLTSLAYVSVILSLVFIFFSISLAQFPFHFQLNIHDFSTKIQLFLVGSLLSSLIFLAWGTTYYIQKQYEEKNGNSLEEKIRSVNIELYSKIGKEEFLSSELENYVSSYLVKFSNVFYSDINLYTIEGSLYSTSRPEVFIKGIKSERMNQVAYHALHNENKAQWIQKEKIGKMDYLSAYIPFKNDENELLGYLNLPYFAKQGELEEEISSFLVSTLNIYVGIFALALLISVLLINQLSKPLLLIRKQISKLKLGSAIELIDWKSNDEIGALVQEYNRIAIELSESAALLAKSEREVAWREMAKQVAHEIKNPLTPMKLSIQHLQRAAEAKSEDLEDRINRTTITLIEQIETLSSIATAFSSFAKLPQKSYEKLDVLPILKNTMDLYSHDCLIELFNPEELSSLNVNGDKDQLLRVFNNLIKNAVQAMEEAENPTITVELKEEENGFNVLISDNGIGITETQAERIFEPNFTTKSAGTGLGLAMSKSIIEQMGGSISFESVEKTGTTFKITLPKA